MRASLSFAGLLLALGLPFSGCDSVGADDVPCMACASGDSDLPGSHPESGGSDAGDDGSSAGEDSDGESGGDLPGGSTDDVIPVDPRQTYTRTWKDDALDAPAILLAEYGVAPGDVVCGRAVGDFYTEPGVLASSRGYPLITAVFSSSDVLLPSDERDRVKGAIDTDDDVATLATATDGLETDVAEDVDATDGCITVPDGARYVFLAAYDTFYADNSDALADGQSFGLSLKK
jgi:hypothetical protein